MDSSVHLVLLTMMAYLITVIACIAGLFYTQYKENWLQAIGMVAVGFGSALKLPQIYMRGFVTEETTLLAVGVASFAVGVAWKVWQHQRYLPPKHIIQ